MKTTSCTEDVCYSFNLAPRCGARTKRNNGSCRSPAVRGKKRCRMHGSSAGSGGQVGNLNALKHGATRAKVKIFKKVVKDLMKSSYTLICNLKD